MELYVFSGALLLLGLADDVSRCACTLRYGEAGTLEAVCGNTAHNRSLLRHGCILALRQDRGLTGADAAPFRGRYDGFRIEALEYDAAAGTITVTGAGLSSLLSLRVIPADWTVEGDSAAAIDAVVGAHCVSPSDPARALPFLRLAGGFSGGADVLREGGWETVYDGVRALAELAGTGFTVDLLASRRLVFRQYRGVDHTAERFGPIPLLSEQFGNLIESGYADDRADWRTTAYVRTGMKAADGSETTLVVNGGPEGFDRRELLVSVPSPDSRLTGDERLAYIRAAGEEALLRRAPEQRLEAAVRTDAGLVFRRDYGLGDRFLVRSSRFGLETSLPIRAVTESWEGGAYQAQPILGDEQPQRIRRLAALLSEQN